MAGERFRETRRRRPHRLHPPRGLPCVVRIPNNSLLFSYLRLIKPFIYLSKNLVNLSIFSGMRAFLKKQHPRVSHGHPAVRPPPRHDANCGQMRARFLDDFCGCGGGRKAPLTEMEGGAVLFVIRPLLYSSRSPSFGWKPTPLAPLVRGVFRIIPPSIAMRQGGIDEGVDRELGGAMRECFEKPP